MTRWKLPSVLRRCWLGFRKSIWPVRKFSGEVLAWLICLSEVQIQSSLWRYTLVWLPYCQPFHVAGKFCENQRKACSVGVVFNMCTGDLCVSINSTIANDLHMIQLSPRRLLLHQNAVCFFLSGAGLCMFSWKSGRTTSVVVPVGEKRWL